VAGVAGVAGVVAGEVGRTGAHAERTLLWLQGGKSDRMIVSVCLTSGVALMRSARGSSSASLPGANAVRRDLEKAYAEGQSPTWRKRQCQQQCCCKQLHHEACQRGTEHSRSSVVKAACTEQLLHYNDNFLVSAAC